MQPFGVGQPRDWPAMRRALASVLMSIAHIALAFALNGWWFNHTALNPSSTDKIAKEVLSNKDVNEQLAG